MARLPWVSACLSDERLAPANGVELAYQEIGDPDGEPLFLVMGLAAQMLAWQEDFCAMLAGRGFRVVRFDNRDIGHSTMLDELGMPSRIEMLAGRRTTAPYLLRDMAADTFGLMDHLGLDSAHVVGASMGGMIGQEMAIRMPQRVRSLVSMMSTTGNRRVGSPSIRAWGLLLSGFPHGREQYVRRALRTFRVIGSAGHRDEREIEELAGAMYDRSHNPAGIVRQMHAISASGDRTAGLERLEVPATVLHGADDPLARVAAGRATASAIPDARLRVFEGMGHDLPRALWPDFVDEIVSAAERSRTSTGSRPHGPEPCASTSSATAAGARQSTD
jgi:pimeloyl-ACP methyl ester carboxylesterase